MRTADLTRYISIALCLGMGSVSIADTGDDPDSTRFVRTVPEYSASGQRDPFGSLIPEVEEEGKPIKDLFNYEDGTLKGIVQTDDGPYAMVVDGDGLSYVLYERTRVYGGYVSRITTDAVYMQIVKYGRAMTIILRTQESKNRIVRQSGDGGQIRKPGITIDYNAEDGGTGTVSVEDVVVPTERVRTVEQEWFGVSPEGISGADEETTVKNDMFALYDPPDGTDIRLPYEFDWTNPPVEIAGYTIVIDDDPDFSSPAVTVHDITDSTYLVTEELRLPAGMKLYWKVVATDNNGNMMTSYRSEMSFTIQSEN